MENEDRTLASAMRVIFEADGDDSAFDDSARSLLESARRGESEMALRRQAGDIQNQLTGRVIDEQCRNVVEVVQTIANADEP
jgi:hypothetical protein